MGKDTASAVSSGIGVLDKSVAVLHAIAEAPCNLSELCERTGLPRATAHRLAVGLETHRFLTRDVTGRWQPGPVLGELASSAHDPVTESALMVLPPAPRHHRRIGSGLSPRRCRTRLRRRDGTTDRPA